MQGGLGVFVRGSRTMTPGTAAALRIATHLAPSETVTNPVGNVAVTVTLSGGGKQLLLSQGRTDGSGGLDARFDVPPWSSGKYEIVIRAQFGDQVTVEKQSVELTAAARILLQSDKPLYQPGQTVHLRALTLRAQDGRPLGTGTIRFVVQDPRQNRIFQAEKTLSSFGIASADLPLADDLLLGSYQVQAELFGAAGVPAADPADLKVEVSRYVLPKIRVSVKPDRTYAEPGQSLKLAVAANYFHGKPVSGGQASVKVQLQSPSRHTSLETLSGKLDDKGELALTLPIPAEPRDENYSLILSAFVEDAASQRAETRQEVMVAAQPLQTDVVPESGQLIPLVTNRVHVLAARPDGAPVANAAVSVTVGSHESAPVRATTDAIGIATVEVQNPKPAKGIGSAGDCAATSLALRVEVTEPGRPKITETRCVPVRSDGGLLLRSDKAVYSRGEKMTLTLLSAGVQDGLCFVDVVRDKQLQDTLVVPLNRGQGNVTLPITDRMAGTVSLLAYVVGADGHKIRDSRLVYVERPSALRVYAEASSSSSPSGTPLHPGDSARLRLRVVDADSGVGVKAALGLVMVDEALLALRPLRPGLLRAYFSLGQVARKTALQRRFAPGGVGIETLVERGGLSDLEQEAAKLMLAGAVAPWDDGWESDPWEGRRHAATELTRKWGDALNRYAKGHSLGERVPNRPGKWRYREDLPALLRATGMLTSGEMRDPWRRPVSSEKLVEAAGLPSFDEHAQILLDEKLTTIYELLWKRIGAELKAGTRQKEPDGSVTFGAEELAQLPAGILLDPWATQMRLQTRKKPHKVGSLVSKVVVYSAGPDGVFGNTDDLYPSDNTCYHNSCRIEDRRIHVVGVRASQAFSQIQMGCGCGYGAAGGATFGGHAARLAYAHAGVAEMRGVAGRKDSVRSSFPETLLYRPEVITDDKGEVEVPFEVADSITTWRLLAEAVAQDGRLGSLMMGIPVTQDFFVDLDVPQVVTQHDELSIPVPLYNHLKVGQKVEITLLREPWFEPLSPLSESVSLSAGQAAVRYFRIKLVGVGRRALRLSARGTVASDAVERPIEIVPDGIEHITSVQQRLTAQSAQHAVNLPAMIIPSTSEVTLKLYPAPSSHVVEGLDALLRMPHGCFEQTSSTTYPNALILRYLRRTHKATPAVERKALEYLQTGYQKLLSFEVAGGGFSWFGNAPAHKILTAYGIEEFADMAEVFPVDRKVIDRTQRWLVSQQRSDGSFDADDRGIREGAINAVADDKVRSTAFIALAIKRTDASGTHRQAVERAREYVRRSLTASAQNDPYTLSLLAELLGPTFVTQGGKTADAITDQTLIGKLWALRKTEADGRSAFFVPASTTPTHGGGKSGIIETTALAASTLQRSSMQGQSGSALLYLVSAKDSFGTWHSTQATIRSLKAMIEQQDAERSIAHGVLDVSWDGAKHSSIAISEKEDNLRIVTLPTPSAGSHSLSLQFAGKGVLDYQLVTRYYQPRAEGAPPPSQPAPSSDVAITVETKLSSASLKRNDALVQTVILTAQKTAMMPLAQVGVPPGFSVDKESLDLLVSRNQIEKYEVMPRYVNLYLRLLEAKERKELPIAMTAQLPGRVQIPAASVYPYYEPEQTAHAEPQRITVLE